MESWDVLRLSALHLRIFTKFVSYILNIYIFEYILWHLGHKMQKKMNKNKITHKWPLQFQKHALSQWRCHIPWWTGTNFRISNEDIWHMVMPCFPRVLLFRHKEACHLNAAELKKPFNKCPNILNSTITSPDDCFSLFLVY